ncbi:unnamed protein product [Orchesella dallaii]|uniref:Replicase polyprotein 1a n=1 Tax=Orchesella dallaii TaxID=48710 RepID=A0ABP1Q6L0_9HEXA
MRVPVSLPFVAGTTFLLLAVLLVHSDGKAVEKSELAKQESNTIPKTPSLFNLFRSFIPSSKTIANLASAASSMPQARSINGGKQQAKKKDVKATGTVKKSKSTNLVKTTSTSGTTRVPKSRQNNRNAGFDAVKPPVASEMQVLTYTQKRDRLRQALVDETQENCLAKILCGVRPSQSQSQKTKSKDPNLGTETAYLIKEFFNIFDISDDEFKDDPKPINDKQPEVQNEEKEADDKEEDDDSDDDADDEEDDILRATPVTESPSQLKKYSTNQPKKPIEKSRTSKPMGSFTEIPKKVKPAPTPTATSDIKVDKKQDKNGVTPSTEVITTTMISTSMTGSATLIPLDMPFEIPLKTAKDDAEESDDDEEEDNHKYDEDDENDSKYHKVTLEELVGDIKLSPGDLEMMGSRRGRSMKLSLNDVTPNKYIQSKIRQMRKADSEVTKMRIAGQVASSFRQPRQCRQFSQVAQEVLQSCPLTTEVIRFFNSNLRNGTQIEIKKIPQGSNSTGGGLVVLNNDVDGPKQAYFVDNSPQVANTKITTDLKNPSIPTSFNEDEVQFPIYEKKPNPNPQNSNLNQHGQDTKRKPKPQPPKEPSKEDSEEEQDDEPESDEEADDDDDDDDDEEEEEDENGEEEDEEDEEEDAEDDESSNDSEKAARKKPKKSFGNSRPKIDHEQLQGQDTNQPNFKVVIKPKKPPRQPPQGPTLPPGIIRVYGVPQPSFDKDFSVIADQIGNRPVINFGEEDIDRPDYKRRRQLVFRSSMSGKSDNDEDENVPFSSRIPKHPPLEPFVNDGNDDDDDDEGKTPYQTQKKNNNVGGKPLGGIKGADVDDDDDDDYKNKVTNTKKGNSNDKDNDNDNDKEDQSVEAANNPPFVPSMMYNSGIVSQSQSYNHDYYQHGVPIPPVPRPRVGYRPLVRPIQIMPDANIPMAGLNFRASPGREFMRPGRLYPLYHHGKK